MKKSILALLFALPLFLSAQNNDWKELQSMLDSARTSPTGVVTVARNYIVDKPLIIHNWDGSKYNQVSIVVQGYATMWDRGQRSVIKATFNDAPILSIQTAKGVIIRGLNLQGPSIGRDSRYSPQAGICIDPFSGLLPADSGYPSLREWYRGPQTRSGSTGIRVEDCTVNNTTVGIITSPNGFTQNAEIITYQNIRLQAVKYGIVGCQAQEKQNRILNLGAWGPTQCLFVFNRYGAGQPGHWIIDGVNIAGGVDSIISRASTGWGPLFMTNVFAESIRTVGFWYAGSGDLFTNSLINLKFPNELGYYPENAIDARYLTMKDVNIRYYGATTTPMLLYRLAGFIGGAPYVPTIIGTYGWEVAQGYTLDQPFARTSDTVINNKTIAKLLYGKTMPTVGSHIVFMTMGDWAYTGQGQIERVSNDTAFIKWVSPPIKNLSNSRIGVYIKK